MNFKNTIGLGLFCMLAAFAGRVSAQEVTIDLSKEYQTIRGFGGMNFTKSAIVTGKQIGRAHV